MKECLLLVNFESCKRYPKGCKDCDWYFSNVDDDLEDLFFVDELEEIDDTETGIL